MPIYEYKCRECNEIIEVLQKINSEPLEYCTKCNGKVEKLISSSSFQFKGNGWYVTDYKKSDKGNNSKKSITTNNKNVSKETKNKTATKGNEKNVA
ncbi:MAG: FmdB family zinc ribbon protein [Acidobacteriota bacterium]